MRTIHRRARMTTSVCKRKKEKKEREKERVWSSGCVSVSKFWTLFRGYLTA